MIGIQLISYKNYKKINIYIAIVRVTESGESQWYK